jgi:hypothetical protein
MPTARKLMMIVGHPVLSKRAHGHDLPNSWTTRENNSPTENSRNGASNELVGLPALALAPLENATYMATSLPRRNCRVRSCWRRTQRINTAVG